LVANRDSSPLAGVQNDKIISLAGSQVCHSEGGRSPTEESLNESLVAKRDSSAFTKPQNDNSGRVSSNSNRDSSPVSQAQNDNESSLY
ncbi:hypothetical protein, partial [Helicobacter marmotae]|uniref:hypothetical protein n=1 Tax=Helicobacter marmotae TaxID=152490 RepID=UPI001315993B